MNTIRKEEPKTWQERQQFAAHFWEQCGLSSKMDFKIETSDGTAVIDICTDGETGGAGTAYLCACRYWSDPVSEKIIQDFATIVHESGAECGFILISAAQLDVSDSDKKIADIKLLTWQDFQNYFSQQWIRYQTDRVQQDAEDLRNYCDSLERYVSKRLKNENNDFRERYSNLSEKHMSIGMLAHNWNLPNTLVQGGELFEILDCRDAWQFMIKLNLMLKEGLKEFDELFCEKWRRQG